MEVILSYLENMFVNLPKTPEVLRAKEELASMMEDKYSELLAEGRKENEAIGIVISEFGDISELVEELNYKNEEYWNTANAAEDMSIRVVSRAEAEEYMEVSQRSCKWIALGVMICILSPIPLFLCGGIADAVRPLSDGAIVLCGLVPLLIMIGIAVAMFIHNGSVMQKFEYLKKEKIKVDPVYERELVQMAEEERPAAERKLIISVLLFIFAVIPLLISGGLTDEDIVHVAALCFMMCVIAIGVALIIVGQNRQSCIKVLLQQEDYTLENKKSNRIMNAVSSVYWCIVTAVYLGWSLYTMHWGITWVIWPVAGVLYVAIEAIVKVILVAAEKEI